MSATDGTFVCSLCGDWRTGCLLCGQAPLTDRREEIWREAADATQAEIEGRAQERSIRAAADSRRAALNQPAPKGEPNV